MTDPLEEETAEQTREAHICELMRRLSECWPGSKFYAHVERVLCQLPPDVLDNLVENGTIFFAPDDSFYGRYMVLPSNRAGVRLLYLSPLLLKKEPEVIEYTIAHEIAHFHLGHEENVSATAREDAERGELEAEALVRDWFHRGATTPPQPRSC
jgi:hypothetical protein